MKAEVKHIDNLFSNIIDYITINTVLDDGDYDFIENRLKAVSAAITRKKIDIKRGKSV